MLSKFVKGNYAPILEQHSSSPTIIVFGTIPESFENGQYVRNGPNPSLQMKDVPQHWFDGTGMLHGLHFTNQSPVYTNKYILTPRYITEKVTGQQSHFLIGSTLTGSLKKTLSSIVVSNTVKSIMGNNHYTTANTALSFQNGRLLAAMEADLPVWMLAPGLETVGLYDFDKQLSKGAFEKMTAHPKINKENGEVVLFSYDLKSGIGYSVMDKNQKFIIDKFVITQCRQGMFHDFGVCKDYSVFVDSSISFNTQKLPPLYVDDQKMIHIVIIPRYIKSLTETILIKLDFSGAAFHVANTFQTETSIIVQVHISKNLDTFTDPFEDFPIFEGYTDSAPYLYIFEISLETRTATHRIVSCDPTEFPVINSDYEGKKNEWVWAGYLEPGYTHKMNGQVKINIQTGLIEKKYKFDKNTFGGEFSFVKRIDGSKEDDGYLCGYVFEERVDLGVMHGNSYFLIICAESMELVCRIECPSRIPYGFHGIFLTSEDIQSQIKVEKVLNEDEETQKLSKRMFGLGRHLASFASKVLS